MKFISWVIISKLGVFIMNDVTFYWMFLMDLLKWSYVFFSFNLLMWWITLIVYFFLMLKQLCSSETIYPGHVTLSFFCIAGFSLQIFSLGIFLHQFLINDNGLGLFFSDTVFFRFWCLDNSNLIKRLEAYLLFF